jgi:hypothetical protein
MASPKGISTKMTGGGVGSFDTKPGQVHDQINKLKSDIDMLNATNCNPPPDLGLVLYHMWLAEDSLQKEKSQKDELKAWYDLMNAKLIYHQKIAPYFSGEPNEEMNSVKQELRRMWYQVAIAQFHKPEINTAHAADWLRWGETRLNQDPKDISYAMYCILRARGSLAKAQECVEKKNRGLMAITIEVLYLLLIPVTVVAYHVNTGMLYADIVRNMTAETVLHVPRYVFFWGFLGGASWCIYNAAHWTKRRLFDPYYLPWYIAHPWVSSILGGASSLMIMGGLNSLTKGIEADKDVAPALLSLVSFIAGFSTHQVWKRLDKIVSKLFGGEDVERARHEESQKDVYKVQ